MDSFRRRNPRRASTVPTPPTPPKEENAAVADEPTQPKGIKVTLAGNDIDNDTNLGELHAIVPDAVDDNEPTRTPAKEKSKVRVKKKLQTLSDSSSNGEDDFGDDDDSSSDSDTSVGKKPWEKQDKGKGDTMKGKQGSIPKKKRDTTEGSKEIPSSSIPKRQKRDSSEEKTSIPKKDAIPKKKKTDSLEEPTVKKVVKKTADSSLIANMSSQGKPSSQSSTIGSSNRYRNNNDYRLSQQQQQQQQQQQAQQQRMNGDPPTKLSSERNKQKLAEEASRRAAKEEQMGEGLETLIKKVLEGRIVDQSYDANNINWDGSFMKEGEELDFFKRDRNGEAIMQAEIPMFEKDFSDKRKAWPLKWWGIRPPTEEDHPIPPATRNRGKGSSNSQYNRRDEGRSWRHPDEDTRANRPNHQSYQQRDGGYGNRERRWQGGDWQRQRMDGNRNDGNRGHGNKW